MSEVRLSMDAIRQVIAEAMRPANFRSRAPLCLTWAQDFFETIPWEIFRGQLVPARLTRQTRTFESWHCFGTDEFGRSEEPLLSVKLDNAHGELHVVRALLCYVWEGYDSGGNVYLSREVQRWVRELVGSLRLANSQTVDQLRAKLSRLLMSAVVGSSRLPLTSLESPMPGWSLGRLAYFPSESRVAAFSSEFAPKAFEWLIRRTEFDEMPVAASQFLDNWRKLNKSPQDTCRLFRSLFNEISLSPYTDFVDKSLRLLRLLVERAHLCSEQYIDFLGWLLRQLARHLTAYDLVTFHHRGANYPDALLLDAALREYVRVIEEHPAHFLGDQPPAVVRRGAMRLGWLHRRRYEGHRVPDAPTSPGENARVLPPPHVRVPEEQILNIGTRKKRLYDSDPLSKYAGAQGVNILKQCGEDLNQVSELRQLGMAIFIERPLSAALALGEPDDSPLLAHEAFSRSLAERALKELASEPLMGMTAESVKKCRELLGQACPPGGMLAAELPVNPARVVSLADAAKAATDFVILRTLPGSVRAFANYEPVAKLLAEKEFSFDIECDWLIVARSIPDGNLYVSILSTAGHESLRIELDGFPPR